MSYLEDYNLNEEISEFTIKINDDYSNRYAEACGIKNYNSGYVNPTELATLSLKYFLEQFPIPEGSIHTAQEVEIFKEINKNDEFKGVIKITNYKEIKESLFIKIKTNFIKDNEIIASSEGTLVVPKK
tara:strand:- start:295 stop:678 length:384 start_codon:yes stop_codon:yes gene_type:complete